MRMLVVVVVVVVVVVAVLPTNSHITPQRKNQKIAIT
jgi:hypothetical protein